ncbi:MAG: terminase small subunit [Ruminococcus sp.]|nr:terminase small subunit [Ruminococcus sp.]
MLGDVTESAIKAGFDRKNALQNGIKLLESDKCRKLISRIRNAVAGNNDVATGLKRLAFGNCTDAVYLVFADELPPPDVISRLDLFNVSEIKRIKGGGVEIKFFDRLKALEKLFELENTFSDKDKATDLIKALADSSTDGESLEN